MEDDTLFHDTSRNIILQSLNCTGTEPELIDCDSELPVMCQENNLAAVVCQGKCDRMIGYFERDILLQLYQLSLVTVRMVMLG